jgi:hypothetical protein
MSPARRFLWVIAILIMLVVAGLIAYWLFGTRLLQAALTPTTAFSAETAGPQADYTRPESWAAHPALAGHPARYVPEGATPAAGASPVAVFHVSPTSFFERGRWNAPFTDKAAQDQGAKFLRLQASALNAAGEVWAPLYRQATFGTFLSTDRASVTAALDLAYADVEAAFEAFLAALPADAPLILSGHSQGSLHLKRLIARKVAGTPIAARIIAVYAPGWPISVEADLPAMGLPACTTPSQTGCILAWQAFADPADPQPILDVHNAATGLTGQPARGTAMLCTNPLSGSAAAADASANLGSLVPAADFASGRLVPKGLGARCLASGILDIGPPPSEFTAFILPGNNFHVYDIPLFWANLRADAQRRAAAFTAAPPAP